MPAGLWNRARQTQLALSANGDHRRAQPADLLLATAAEEADVNLIHYDRVRTHRRRWFSSSGLARPRRDAGLNEARIGAKVTHAFRPISAGAGHREPSQPMRRQ